MKEIWKPIKDYEGLYEVSDLGRVKSLYHDREKILAKRVDTAGYVTVILYKGKNKKSFIVHRLVAEAFIPNPENKPFINHKDENKTNNIYSNLEWVTQSENISYSIGKQVDQFDLDNNYIKTWNTSKEAEKTLKISNGKVTAVCKNHRKTAGGFIWRYHNAQTNETT